MNAVLLALLAGATWQLTLGSAAVAGLLIGTANALKAFPALLILYFAARRYWTDRGHYRDSREGGLFSQDSADDAKH